MELRVKSYAKQSYLKKKNHTVQWLNLDSLNYNKQNTEN